MKRTLGVIFLLFSFLFSSADVPEEIVAALKQGKSTDLVKHFGEKVSVKISNQEDVLSKSQAEANIKYFFDKHAVKAFTSSHISSMNNSAQYITGTLETSNGKFRVSILIRNNLISQFRIEDDNE
ncbi:MAG: DUF4783 domain-containing protein [Bacteroidetes bacterium]|nr:DUF4783 domain-containing protein [Bacteroidota bacterium]